MCRNDGTHHHDVSVKQHFQNIAVRKQQPHHRGDGEGSTEKFGGPVPKPLWAPQRLSAPTPKVRDGDNRPERAAVQPRDGRPHGRRRRRSVRLLVTLETETKVTIHQARTPMGVNDYLYRQEGMLKKSFYYVILFNTLFEIIFLFSSCTVLYFKV